MKILQINTEKGWRGGERQTFLLARALVQAGHQVTVLCRAGHPLARGCLEQNIPVIEASGQAHALLLLSGKGRSHDIIHAQTGKGQSLAVLTKPLHRRPVLCTRRVVFRPRGFAARLKYRQTTEVAAISPAIRDILQPLIPEKSIPVIPSCIDTSRPSLKPGPAAVELRQKHAGKIIIATTAALTSEKDPLTMLRAVHALKKICPRKFVFLHFGRGELQELVKQEINRLGLEKEYLLMGFEPEVENFFPVFDLFVMSSSEEGLGSSVLEAFRYMVPVVSTTAGGLESLVQNRGLLCPVHDHKCLAAKIKELLDSPEQCTELTRKAREYVLAEHSLEAVCGKYIQTYRTLLGKKDQPEQPEDSES